MLNIKGNILILGAHSDDIEIGCLGFILKNKNAIYDFMVISGDDLRIQEFLSSVSALKNDYGVMVDRSINLAMGDTALAEHRIEIKQKIKNFTNGKHYDYIFTHHRDDLHQDHRLVGELTLEVFRKNQIVAYEIPKYDGLNFFPSLYVTLDEDLMNKKCKHLMDHFKSQREKNWFNEDVFKGIASIRGIESAAKFAEAFLPVKLFL